MSLCASSGRPASRSSHNQSCATLGGRRWARGSTRGATRRLRSETGAEDDAGGDGGAHASVTSGGAAVGLPIGVSAPGPGTPPGGGLAVFPSGPSAGTAGDSATSPTAMGRSVSIGSRAGAAVARSNSATIPAKLRAPAAMDAASSSAAERRRGRAASGSTFRRLSKCRALRARFSSATLAYRRSRSFSRQREMMAGSPGGSDDQS